MKTHYIVNSELTDAQPEALFRFEAPAGGGDVRLARQDSIIPFRFDDLDLVRKSYFRGGLPGRLIRRTYVYTGLERTRMWREYRLLLTMKEFGLPVPEPLAARCQLSSLLTYTGDLVMTRISDSRTLAESVTEAPLPEHSWARIGKVIARFHRHRVCHQDLNASNILISEDDSIHLIDFDKCGFRGSPGSPPGSWAQDNLRRLQRSLLKHSAQKTRFHFEDKHWLALKTGYGEAL